MRKESLEVRFYVIENVIIVLGLIIIDNNNFSLEVIYINILNSDFSLKGKVRLYTAIIRPMLIYEKYDLYLYN